MSKYTPDYAKLHPWEIFSANLMTEYEQLRDEGHAVARYEGLAKEIAALPAGQEREDMALHLAQLMQDTPQVEGYRYEEPSTLPEIQAARKPIDKPLPAVDQDGLRAKIKGAWLGRIAGCLLGKPIEGIRTAELNHVLQATGNYPLQRYILASELTDELYDSITFPLRGRCFADTIDAAPVDDDTNYTVLAACKLLPKYGRGFTSDDVAHSWIANQSKDAYCTAERVAFLNLVNGYYPPVSALRHNPFREWIGAQIRGDYYGYINPADPQTAADMAWRDGSISHIKNGIYGEMFVAAMVASAAVCDDVREVILCGLAEIPERSRLYEQSMELIALYDAGKPVADAVAYVTARYDEHSAHDWCHTLSNALIVELSLLWGEKDFGRTICLAVGCGFDTDCNGATAGSVLGMMIGEDGIPAQWTDAFHGQLQTSIFGVSSIAIDELVDLTLSHIA